MSRILLLCLVAISIVIDYTKDDVPNQKQPVFIWNDDHESIPKDGDSIVIEMTVNDTIYLGNINKN
jgi:hypothetical protein